MREAAHKKMVQILIVFLIIAVIIPTVSIFATTSRYDQSGSFAASGSPLLNSNFTSDAWNKWEIVAWGVFLSNFVVPMADTYESAFSTSSGYGSHGSGYKALNFSQGADPANSGVLSNFLQFAMDQAMTGQLKPLYTTYYYMDVAGNIIENNAAGNAQIIDESKNPTKNANIQPVEKSNANFRDILLVNIANSHSALKTEVLSGDTGGWFYGTNYVNTDEDDIFGKNTALINDKTYNWGKYELMMALPPVAGSYNKGFMRSSSDFSVSNALNTNSGVNDIAFAKLPVLWVEGADKTYVKVWDMLDPWDYQVAIAMLAKEVNSDSEIDSGVGQEAIWDTVANNIDRAFKDGNQLFMDSFGNIVCLLDGRPYVVIPAAYNKHITTEPVVNLVNSLFLTGPTSGIDGSKLIRLGKQPVLRDGWWISNDNETSNNQNSRYGAGMSAFGWTGGSFPENAVTLYFDTDSVLTEIYKDVMTEAGTGNSSAVKNLWQESLTYNSFSLTSLIVPNYAVLDLDLQNNRQLKYTRTSNNKSVSTYVVPKLELSGISKAGNLGESLTKRLSTGSGTVGTGVESLFTLVAYGSTVANLLSASYNEANTTYIETITWRNDTTSIFGNPVIVPTAFEAGITTDKKEKWAYLARDFINFYGTVYYPSNRAAELSRASTVSYNEAYGKLTYSLMYSNGSSYGTLNSEAPSAAVIAHSNTSAVRPYMKVMDMTKEAVTGFIWNVDKYIKKDLLADEWGGNDGENYRYLTKRWVKAYPTNQVLTEVASYLGMRGDSEFAAAAAPYVYLSYLQIYGVDKVKSLTLNENPTKFNENIYDAKGSPLFNFDPTANTNIKSDEEMSREVSIYTWQLLSPTSGNEYKRELLSSIVGNFVYDQYNRTVFGGSLEYRSGGVQQIVTRSQTGFLRFPSLEDNMFTSWFYNEYATVALWLLAAGLVFIVVFGIFRKRKMTWFLISTVLLVSSVVVIPLTNDLASASMDGLVSNIMKDKTTIWSLTEMLANERAEQDFLSTGLDSEAAAAATDIMRDLSIVYTDRSLNLKQDISRKVISLGNYSELQSFASTQWMLSSLVRQFTADDGSSNYLYVPLLDVADNAANIYWWYNPKDAKNAGGIASSDLEAKYAMGTDEGKVSAKYISSDIKKFYPNYHHQQLDASASNANALQLSYRSITQSVGGYVPIHDYIYMYMNNTYGTSTDRPAAVLPASNGSRPVLNADNATNLKYWGDPDKLDNVTGFGGNNTFLNALYNNPIPLNSFYTTLRASTAYDYKSANIELIQLSQKYNRDERDTMTAEFGYIWSTETLYPYFYALVKDTMSASGLFDYQTGKLNNTTVENAWDASNSRLGVMVNALSGVVHETPYYGAVRSNFMHQTGIRVDQLPADKVDTPSSSLIPSSSMVFTGYGRDVLDLESLFYNTIPYMYQMTIITGGLTGDHKNDKGLFGNNIISASQYKTYEGLPESFLYRCNWVAKIVEAPAYNKKETIGYWDGTVKKKAEVTMTYFPDAYLIAGREMVFSEAQMKMMGLNENDLTTLELKLIKLNKDVSTKWTALLNYINTPGLTAEILCRQMALDALTSFNETLTPSGLGNSAFSLYPSSVDLRSLSFDTLMRVILLNSTKNSNYFNTDAMEITILEYDVFTGVLLLITAWVCCYGVTLMRAFFLAFLFIMGVYGVAKSVLAANLSKKATLFGYLVNIALLFLMSLVYYFIFNVLMTGANDAAYVSTGLSGVSASPGWALLVILIASILYCIGMWKMFRIALGSVIAGTGDLGLSAYKEKAKLRVNRISKSIKEIRSSHSYEDMESGVSDTRTSIGAAIAGTTISSDNGGGSSGNKKRSSKTANSLSSGTGSGSRALQGAGSGPRQRSVSAMDDHDSIDSTISRGGNQPTPLNPATNLDDYLAAPNNSDKKKSSGKKNEKK